MIEMTNAESYFKDALSAKSLMNDWEKKFIKTLQGYGKNLKSKISGKQYIVLRDIAIKYSK